MNSRLRIYVESLFDNVERTQEVVELREEILQNVVDKYQDLLTEGKSEEEAYQSAIRSIGDINPILQSMGVQMKEIQLEEKKACDNVNHRWKQICTKVTAIASPFVLSGAIVLYIISVIPAIIASELFESDFAETIGVCIMMLLIAVATGVLVLYFCMKPKHTENIEQNIKEDEEEWNGSEEGKKKYKAGKSLLWSIVLALYFIISFSSGDWHITWIIFLIGGALENVWKAYLELKE